MPKKDKEEKKEGKNELGDLLSSLQEKFGEGAVMTLGEARMSRSYPPVRFRWTSRSAWEACPAEGS